MDFVFHWTNQSEGKYAIQKRDIGKKETSSFIEAGKEIERKENQTSKTHYFIIIDNGLWEVAKINRILKTITYNYIYKGTNRKAIRQYLKKKDIEKVLNNIAEYENKTIRINITPPTKERKEKDRENKTYLKKVMEYYKKEYGSESRNKLLGLIIQRENKTNELKKQQREMKAEIKKINDRLNRIERTANADIEKIDNAIFTIIRSGIKGYERVESTGIGKHTEYQKIIKFLSNAVKINQQVKAGKERQKQYRERKSEKEGKPIRKRGRPRKNDK